MGYMDFCFNVLLRTYTSYLKCNTEFEHRRRVSIDKVQKFISKDQVEANLTFIHSN